MVKNSPVQTQWEVLKKDFLILQNQIKPLKEIPGRGGYKQHEGILDLGEGISKYSSVQLSYLQSPRPGEVMRVFQTQWVGGMTRS